MTKVSLIASALMLASLSNTSAANQSTTAIDLSYTASGIPLIESNPNAPIAIYVDFDGGPFSHDGEILSGYNRTAAEGSDGDPTTFDAMEQQDIVEIIEQIDQYFAMFDVNITTKLEVMQHANAGGWIIITEDYGGGLAHLGGSGLIPNQPYAKAYAAASRSRPESSNRNRTAASEIAHNFGLRHQGICSDGVFTKLSKAEEFDGSRGAIMGSGGGIVNGWRYGDHDGSNACVSPQSDLELIRQKILALAAPTYTGDGYRADDHPQEFTQFAAKFEQSPSGSFMANGIIERPSDKDTFVVQWQGGDMHLQATPAGVSAVDLILNVYDNQGQLISQVDTDNINIEYRSIPELAPNSYFIEVMSKGGYGELGAYQIQLQDESAGPPSSGRLEVAINAPNNDAEQTLSGDTSLTSSDLELVTDAEHQVVGLRFTDIQLPQNAKINNAFIQFQADETDTVETVLTFHAELNSNSEPFARTSNNISARVQSIHSVEWQPTPWVFKGERGLAQRSTNLQPLVQEAVEQSSWVPGQALTFMISGNGKRVAESFDGDPSAAPTLIIEFGDFNSTPTDNEGHDPDDTIGDGNEQPTQEQTATATISTGYDDVEERADGSVSRSSSDLELVQDGSTQQVALRFSRLDVPKDAVISHAYIQFTADRANNEATNLIIRAEDSALSASFSGADHAVSNRELGSRSVSWAPAPWYFAGDAADAQKTPNLAELLQPLVNHQDWLLGNPLTLVISGTGKRVATSFNGNPEQAATLVVQFAPTEQEALNEAVSTINLSSDDAEENESGYVGFSSSDLELITDGGQQVVGLRFSAVDLPVDAEVVDARIQFTSDETDSIATELHIAANLVADAEAIQKEGYYLSSLPLTNAQEVWQVPSWDSAGETGAAQRSPDLTTIVSELQSQPQWQPGNSMLFVIQGSGKRVAISFDRQPAAAPKLIIRYR